MIDDGQKTWLQHYGILKGEPIDRSQFEQQWPLPMAVDASLPKPWFVAAYSGAALSNVLRSDYGATHREGEYHVAGWAMMRIALSRDLYGANGGTLFVLYDQYRTGLELDRIIEVAHRRGIKIETLRDRNSR